ncbi:MAG: phosphate starvation-inducible protein PsiF [Hyphomicrobiales bacterium]|nr:phosphate starvation-inducible protein PsiF [Hyphomicrobiales bacterium]MBV9430502.1 phosphate starvation-inducible protein PsiF [Hyphomicrobiales bacterium]
MTTSLVKYAAAAAMSLCASFALAQTSAQKPATAPARPTAASPVASTPAPGKPRTAISLECSKKADAQGLHGKARRKFRSECKQGKS